MSGPVLVSEDTVMATRNLRSLGAYGLVHDIDAQ